MLTAQQLLDAIWGPAYLVDPAGNILLVGQRHWHAHVGSAPGQPDPKSLIGRNLFEFISGGEVQAIYRQILARIRTDPEHVWELDYRCDSPGMMRALRMTVSAVAGADAGSALFSSQILRERQRPPLSIFEIRQGAGPDAGPIGAVAGDLQHVPPRSGPAGPRA
jgi:hypothetical protein